MGELSGSQPVRCHWLSHRRGLCQLVACPQCSGGSHEAGLCVPTVLLWQGRAAANPPGGKGRFAHGKAESWEGSWAATRCHSPRGPWAFHLLGITARGAKPLERQDWKGFFSRLFSLKPFSSLRTQGAQFCSPAYVAKPRHEVVGEHWNAQRLQGPGVGRCVRENSIQSHGCLGGISVIFLFIYCLDDKANMGKKELERA